MSAQPQPSTGVTPTNGPRRVTHTLAWIVVAVIVAVAGAGLILTLDHPPTDEGRPELTARGHALVAPRLTALEPDLEALAVSGDAVAGAGRDTLTRLRALDAAGATDALAAGDTAVSGLAAVRDRSLAARAGLLEGTSLGRVPTDDRVRIEAIDAALDASSQLAPDWQAVVAAASGPRDLLEAMNTHDAAVIAATDSGRAGDWAGALASLKDAATPLITVRTVREVAKAQDADTSTLDDLLSRLEEYDAALTELYASLQTSGGVTTTASQAAEARVTAAQGSLPESQDAMVVVMSDLAGPAITPVLLRIETARGALEAAIEAEPTPAGSVGAPDDSSTSVGTDGG